MDELLTDEQRQLRESAAILKDGFKNRFHLFDYARYQTCNNPPTEQGNSQECRLTHGICRSQLREIRRGQPRAAICLHFPKTFAVDPVFTSLGNLLVCSLIRMKGSLSEAIDALRVELGVPHTILPVSDQSTHICAELADGLVAERPERSEDAQGPGEEDRIRVHGPHRELPHEEQQEQDEDRWTPPAEARHEAQPATGRKSFVNSEP